MPDEKFVLPSKKKKPDYDSRYPVVRINKAAYDVLVEMYNESTLSLCELVSKAVLYASEHVEYQRD